MKYLVLIITLFSAAVDALEYPSITSTVKALRTFSDAHSIETIRGRVVFHLESPLGGSCTSLYLESNDKNSISVLLAAKMSGASVTIYHSDEGSPWYPQTCKATEISLY